MPSELVQVPPEVASLNASVDPAHIYGDPIIAVGEGITVTVVVLIQPVPNVYVMTDVPGVTPVTTPVPRPTVATVVVPLVQVPPPASAKVVVAPAHTVVTPVIAAGNGNTVNVVVTLQPEETE